MDVYSKFQDVFIKYVFSACAHCMYVRTLNILRAYNCILCTFTHVHTHVGVALCVPTRTDLCDIDDDDILHVDNNRYVNLDIMALGRMELYTLLNQDAHRLIKHMVSQRVRGGGGGFN